MRDQSSGPRSEGRGARALERGGFFIGLNEATASSACREDSMMRLVMVSKLAAFAILGGAIGAHLGRSAVREIDPFYFSQPETKFHADLVPNLAGHDIRAPVLPQIDAAGVEEWGSGCVRCRHRSGEYRPILYAAAVNSAEGVGSEADIPGGRDILLDEAPASQGEWITRYQHYPITEVEAAGPEPIIAGEGETAEDVAPR